MITYEVRRVLCLHYALRARLLSLTVGWASAMRQWLLHGPWVGSRIVLAREGREIIGWALVRSHGFDPPRIDVFVRTDKRRQGIGKELVRMAAQGFDRLQALPWSVAGKRLYRSHPAVLI